MSRGKRRPRREAPAAPRNAPGPARSTRSRAAWGWAIAVVIAGAAIFTLLRLRPLAPAATDDAGRMTPEAAYERALALGGEGHWRASLPFYRRSLAGSPDGVWETHLNYGNSLNNITIDYTRRAGHTATETRSSAERVELGREAIAQMERAAALAPDGQTRALAFTRLANTQIVWGFRWESLLSLHAAAAADPGNADLVQREATFRELMRDPTGIALVQANVDAFAAPH